ncbi:interactor of HORMAD1 protein 1 [Rhea pennata]|uniref:interactor of HORMAD1 protein 1 n=1 Tax=Rhea pennata TaxID=8795 RepID=UPI002E260A68
MNVNVWNIKEMFSTPTAPGPNKFSIRGSAPSDYSSLSDSQLLFGSQFCPENTQSVAAPLELGTQSGQQNSQDSEPSIFTKYQTKPQLFDEDVKEKGLLHFGAGKVKSVLENFEANKNKIKDKYDREVLSTVISSIKDRLQGLQACLDKFEETFDSRNKSVLDHLETISKTLQDALQTHCGSLLKAVTDKSQMEQTLLEMEKRLAAKDVEISEVKSSVQLLKEGLESLPAQLSDQHLKLCEQLGFLKLPSTLAELHTFISTAKLPTHMTDNSSQTSPGLQQDCALDKENARWPCCQDRRACSSSLQSRAPCVAAPGLSGGSHTSRQLVGDGTSSGSLNTSSGKKVSPIATERKSALETQSSANSPCMCCASNHGFGSSWKKHCPVPQEVPLPTPLRKAVRRGMKGFKTVTESQQRQPQVCNFPVQNDMSGQKGKNPSTDHAMENTAAGSKARQKSGRIPRNKAAARKKTYPARRKGEFSRCSDSGLKQRMANRILELEGSRKNWFPRYTVTLNSGSSNPVSAAPNQRMLSSVQQRLTKNFLQGPRSSEGMQQLADKRKRNPENKNGANVSNMRRNLWDSSPQENVFSLYSTAGEKQMSCFGPPSSASSYKPCPANTLDQQNMACCSLVFDSDYSD